MAVAVVDVNLTLAHDVPMCHQIGASSTLSMYLRMVWYNRVYPTSLWKLFELKHGHRLWALYHQCCERGSLQCISALFSAPRQCIVWSPCWLSQEELKNSAVWQLNSIRSSVTSKDVLLLTVSKCRRNWKCPNTRFVIEFAWNFIGSVWFGINAKEVNQVC